jgi:hypothetical protein
MMLQQALPRSVPEAGCFVRRANDVGEQNHGKDSVQLSVLVAQALDESLDLVKHLVLIWRHVAVIRPGKLDQEVAERTTELR